MSEEALKQEIRSSAESRANELLADARKKAEAIVSDAEKEAVRIRERKETEATKRLNQMESSEMAKARMECAKTKLTIQSKYLDKAFEEARSAIMSLPWKDPEKYTKILESFILEALDHLRDSGKLVAVARAEDRDLLADILRKLNGSGGVSLSNETLDAAGGVLFRSENSRVYYVNTFESRFLKSMEDLRAEVVATLLRKSS